MGIRVYLDDERTPEQAGVSIDWVRTYTPETTIALLEVPGLVDEISLDNDLGLEDASNGVPREGYTVFKWIENKVATDDAYIPPVIHVHTSNTVQGNKMRAGVEAIYRLLQKRLF